MNIRQALEADLKGIATVYRECFPREKNHGVWIESTYKSFPRGVYYIAVSENEICGYILWCVKNGFREKAIVELEQIGVRSESSNQGIGRKLIGDSFDYFKKHVQGKDCSVGAVVVTTSEDSYTERLYCSILGVSRESVIPNYGSSNEAVLYKKYSETYPEIVVPSVVNALKASWSSATAMQWSPGNPANGQCNVTAILIHDLFGGEILKTKVVGGFHFYNRIGGRCIDFTASQFQENVRYADIVTSRGDAYSGIHERELIELRANFKALYFD